jgi:hypothetical protein
VPIRVALKYGGDNKLELDKDQEDILARMRKITEEKRREGRS